MSKQITHYWYRSLGRSVLVKANQASGSDYRRKSADPVRERAPGLIP